MRRPPAGSFVLDENLSPQLAEALRLLDPDAQTYFIADLFPRGSDDTTFLPALGQTGAFLVTRDTRQRRKPPELAAYRRHKVGAFILGGKNLQRWDLVKQIVLAWPQLKDTAKTAKRPFAYKVRASGGKFVPLAL